MNMRRMNDEIWRYSTKFDIKWQDSTRFDKKLRDLTWNNEKWLGCDLEGGALENAANRGP